MTVKKKLSFIRFLYQNNTVVFELSDSFIGNTFNVKDGGTMTVTKNTPFYYSPFTDTFFFEDEYYNKYEVVE